MPSSCSILTGSGVKDLSSSHINNNESKGRRVGHSRLEAWLLQKKRVQVGERGRKAIQKGSFGRTRKEKRNCTEEEISSGSWGQEWVFDFFLENERFCLVGNGQRSKKKGIVCFLLQAKTVGHLPCFLLYVKSAGRKTAYIF